MKNPFFKSIFCALFFFTVTPDGLEVRKVSLLQLSVEVSAVDETIQYFLDFGLDVNQQRIDEAVPESPFHVAVLTGQSPQVRVRDVVAAVLHPLQEDLVVGGSAAQDKEARALLPLLLVFGEGEQTPDSVVVDLTGVYFQEGGHAAEAPLLNDHVSRILDQEASDLHLPVEHDGDDLLLQLEEVG